jgi:hypothetical protein
LIAECRPHICEVAYEVRYQVIQPEFLEEDHDPTDLVLDLDLYASKSIILVAEALRKCIDLIGYCDE